MFIEVAIQVTFMLIKDNEIFLDLEDHGELTRILLGKMQVEGISIRESVIFPVSVESSWVLNGMLMSNDGTTIRDITWMPGNEKPPIMPEIKNVLFLEDIVENDHSHAKNGKHILGYLVKKFKLEKKMKSLKFFSLCWFSNTEFQEIGNNIKLLPAIHARNLAGIHLAPLADANKEGSRPLGFTDAVDEFTWEPQHVYIEIHEKTLQKIRTELW
ncbi:MAG TPA: hypothetical protein VKM55_17880 [Candidatus Lokiarchaeia archaeon]|nr:hypothetical protein [Candidatus Lokiarchaeia archaeon]